MAPDNPTVSVVIPAYGRPALLERAIESVLDQLYGEFECIVVDDGSPDSDPIAPFVENFADADDRIRLITHEENRGAGQARSTGIDHARGKWVSFLDSDDRWHPEKLARERARRIAARDELDDSECIGHYCLHETVRTSPLNHFRGAVAGMLDGGDEQPNCPEGGDGLADRIFLDTMPMGGCSTLTFRRDVLKAIGGFDASLARKHDRDISIRAIEYDPSGRMVAVPEVLVGREATGPPGADAYQEANNRYFEKHADRITRLESAGHDVRSGPQYGLMKALIREGRFIEGIAAMPLGVSLSPMQWATLIDYSGRALRDRLLSRSTVGSGADGKRQ